MIGIRARDFILSKAKVQIPFKGDSLNDAMSFGFSYIESQDHIVEYIAANPKMMKKIFADLPDSEISVDKDSIGRLWTARLLVSEKLNDQQLVFSNNTFSAVIDVHINSHGDTYADV